MSPGDRTTRATHRGTFAFVLQLAAIPCRRRPGGCATGGPPKHRKGTGARGPREGPPALWGVDARRGGLAHPPGLPHQLAVTWEPVYTRTEFSGKASIGADGAVSTPQTRRLEKHLPKPADGNAHPGNRSGPAILGTPVSDTRPPREVYGLRVRGGLRPGLGLRPCEKTVSVRTPEPECVPCCGSGVHTYTISPGVRPYAGPTSSRDACPTTVARASPRNPDDHGPLAPQFPDSPRTATPPPPSRGFVSGPR